MSRIRGAPYRGGGERLVPNPAVKVKKRELEKVKSKLSKAVQHYGQKAHDNKEQRCRTVRGFKISHAELGREIKKLRGICNRLEAEIKTLDARVPVREVLDGSRWSNWSASARSSPTR